MQPHPYPFPHLYIESLFHSMLAEQEIDIKGCNDGNWNLITKALNEYYNVKQLIQLEDDIDRAYILRTKERAGDRIIIAISGTKSRQGWIRNGKIWKVDGWHYGFVKSFTEMLLHPVTLMCKNFSGEIIIYGHSAGSPISLRTNFYLRQTLKKNCESITWCGPQAIDKEGRKQCRKAKLHNTTLNVDPHDPIDDIGKLIGGVDHGYIVQLPDIGSPSIHKNWIVDNLFYGHAPSYVCNCLCKLFNKWGFDYTKEIDSIKKYAPK